MSEIRVLIVDDHAILRDGINTLLDRQLGIRVIGQAGNGYEAIELVEKLNPDIVLMDIAMPKMNGLEATQKISDLYPEVKILILTQHNNREFIIPMLQAGASGYILKKSGGRELVNAIHEIDEQGAFIEPEITRQILDDYSLSNQEISSTEIHLTDREKDVLNLVVSGKSNKEVAYILGISPKTVSVHRSNIMKKLNVHNIFQLLRVVSQHHLLKDMPTIDFIDKTF